MKNWRLSGRKSATNFSLPRDPKDAPYVDLAVASNAGYLVSRDKDLLELMQDEAFRRRFPNLKILEPVSFLREIARLADEEPPKSREAD
jgi:predicted nucleic acid-binding protein